MKTVVRCLQNGVLAYVSCQMGSCKQGRSPMEVAAKALRGDHAPTGEKAAPQHPGDGTGSAGGGSVGESARSALEHFSPCVEPPPLPNRKEGFQAKRYGVMEEGSLLGDRNTVRVHFLNGPRLWRDRVMYWASRWSDHTGIRFLEVNNLGAEMRVQFFRGLPGQPKGSWSVAATQTFLMTNLSQPTQNYGWIRFVTPESDMRALVLHEMGHALGFGHEHQNPKGGIEWNREAVLAHFKDQLSPAEIEHNILRKLPLEEIRSTTYDPHSIMGYNYPKELTLNGVGSLYNTDLSPDDKAFARSQYNPLPTYDVFQEVTGQVVDFDFDFFGRLWVIKEDNTVLRQKPGPRGVFEEIGFLKPEYSWGTDAEHPGGEPGLWLPVGSPERIGTRFLPPGASVYNPTTPGLVPWMRRAATALALSRVGAGVTIYSPQNRQIGALDTLSDLTPWDMYPSHPAPTEVVDMAMLGSRDRVTVLDAANSVHSFSQALGWGSPQLPQGRGFVSLAVGRNRVWAVTTGGAVQEWVQTADGGSWRTLPSPPALKVAANEMGTVWIWGQDRMVYRADPVDVDRGNGQVWKSHTWNPLKSEGKIITIPEMRRFKADVFGDFAYIDGGGTLRQWAGAEGRRSIRPYTDTEGSAYESHIYSAMRHKLVSGFPDGTFRPKQAVTREQAAAIAVNLVQVLMNLPAPKAQGAFKDVAPNRWSAKAIAMAQQLGIVKGFPDGTFKPETAVTRGQLASMMLGAVTMVRTAKGHPPETPAMADFEKSRLNTEHTNIQGHWARTAILKMSQHCASSENPPNDYWRFQPDQPATREYTAAMMVRSATCLTEDTGPREPLTEPAL